MALFGLFGRAPARRGNPNALSPAALTAAGIAGLQIQGDPSLTAAGFRITHQDADSLRRLIQPWQARSFSYYDQLGEIKYAAQFYARMLAPLRLYPAKRDENDEWLEIEQNPDDGPAPSGDDLDAIDALDRIQDPGGGREALLSSYGRLMFLAGEALLFCSIDPETGEEQWEMLSTDELRVQSGVYIRYKAPSLLAEEYRRGMRQLATYCEFQSRADRLKNELLVFLIEQKRAGRSVAAYGAAAKGTTLLNYAGVKSDLLPFVCDAAPSKQGKFLPGAHIPILPTEKLRERQPAIVLILPWNIADEVVAQHDYVRGWGGRFVVAVPSLRDVG